MCLFRCWKASPGHTLPLLFKGAGGVGHPKSCGLGIEWMLVQAFESATNPNSLSIYYTLLYYYTILQICGSKRWHGSVESGDLQDNCVPSECPLYGRKGIPTYLKSVLSMCVGSEFCVLSHFNSSALQPPFRRHSSTDIIPLCRGLCKNNRRHILNLKMG